MQGGGKEYLRINVNRYGENTRYDDGNTHLMTRDQKFERKVQLKWKSNEEMQALKERVFNFYLDYMEKGGKDVALRGSHHLILLMKDQDVAKRVYDNIEEVRAVIRKDKNKVTKS